MFLTAGSRVKAGSKPFPSGTILAGFRQSFAPLGWTKLATHNDVGLRIVSGATSEVSGQSAFSTVFAQTATGAHTLTTAELAAHTHPQLNESGSCGGVAYPNAGAGIGTTTPGPTGSNGSGSSHTHPVTLNLNYVDVIQARKN